MEHEIIKKTGVFGDSILKGIKLDRITKKHIVKNDIDIDKIGGKHLVSIDNFSLLGSTINKGKTLLQRHLGRKSFDIVLPMEIRPDRKVAISMKNMILFARKRTGRSMAEKLAAELMAAYKLEGGAYKKKEDTHRMAEANKAFAHFRF